MTLRHLVFFKFKSDTSTAEIRSIEEAFTSLARNLDEVQSFEWGVNNSPEGLNKYFSHCFNLTFAGEAARNTYLPHPKHLAFVEQLKPLIDDVLVFDYAV
jgi:Stress responsive A/B Barrel Domain